MKSVLKPSTFAASLQESAQCKCAMYSQHNKLSVETRERVDLFVEH